MALLALRIQRFLSSTAADQIYKRTDTDEDGEVSDRRLSEKVTAEISGWGVAREDTMAGMYQTEGAACGAAQWERVHAGDESRVRAQ